MKCKVCLTNMTSFYDKMREKIIDEGKALDVIYLDFYKIFHTVSDCIQLEKLAARALDNCTVRKVKN